MLEKYLQDIGKWNSLELKKWEILLYHELYIISNHDSLFKLPVISTKRTFIISFRMFSCDVYSMNHAAWNYIYSYLGIHLPCTEHVSTSMFVFAMIYLKFKFELRRLMTLRRYSTNWRQACNNSMNRICPAFQHENLQPTLFPVNTTIL